MQKGFIKFLKPTKFNGRRFRKDELVAIDEIGLTKAQFSALVKRK